MCRPTSASDETANRNLLVISTAADYRDRRMVNVARPNRLCALLCIGLFIDELITDKEHVSLFCCLMSFKNIL